MAVYLRKLWAKKPRQWGPKKRVAYAVRRYCEDVAGCSAPLIYLPLWEKAGNYPHDYGSIGAQLSPANGTPTQVWKGNYLDCSTDVRRFEADDYGGKIPTTGGTFITTLKRVSNSNTNQSIGYIRNASTNSRVGWRIYGSGAYISLGDYTAASLTAKVIFGETHSYIFNWNPDQFTWERGAEYSYTGSDSNYSDSADFDKLGILDYAGSTAYNVKSAHVYQWLYFGEELSEDQRRLFSDNPYAMIQRPDATFYSFPDPTPPSDIVIFRRRIEGY